MITITIILLLAINLYGFIYSMSITKYHFLENQKIQTKVNSFKLLLNRCPLIIFNVSILIVLNFIGIKFFHSVFLREFNSYLYSGYEVLFVLLVDDFFFYVLHRMMHESTYIYKKIHKIHHRANTPMPFEYIYVHPLEWMSGMIGPFLGMYLLGGISFFAYCVYLVVRNIHEIHIHSGIKTSQYLKHVPLYGINEHHDVHHSRRMGNYASTFTFWDILLKTKIKGN